MKNKKTPKDDDEWAPSMANAAARIGCGLPALKRAKAGGCNGFRGCRVNLRIATEWLKDNKPAAEDHSKEALEIRRLLAQCLKLEFELAATKKLYISLEHAQAQALRIGGAIRTELNRIVSDAPTWEGLRAADIEERAAALVRSIQSHWSDAASDCWK